MKIREDASSMLAGREGTVVAIEYGGRNAYTRRKAHYKVAFSEPAHARAGLWFDADELDADAHRDE